MGQSYSVAFERNHERRSVNGRDLAKRLGMQNVENLKRELKKRDEAIRKLSKEPCQPAELMQLLTVKRGVSFSVPDLFASVTFGDQLRPVLGPRQAVIRNSYFEHGVNLSRERLLVGILHPNPDCTGDSHAEVRLIEL